jgi:hypothetical protein
MLTKPRFAEEIVAVKLDHDLIAEAGSIVILSVISQADFEKLLTVQHEEIPRSAALKMNPAPSQPKTRNRLSAEQQVLLAFGPDTKGEYLHDLTVSGLSRILPKIPAYRVLDKVGKLIRGRKLTPRMEKEQLCYNITDAGKAESKRIRERK